MDITYQNTSRTLTLPRGSMHYHDVGEGPCLLLLHGSGPGVDGWSNYQHNLALYSRHFRCIVPDLPGYGQSEAVAGEPVMTCVETMLALMNALAIERTHILGNSLGGIVGSHIAARHPHRVNRFISIGGIGLNLFTAFPGEGLSRLTDFAENPTRERLEQWLRTMVFDPSIITEELIEQRYRQATEPGTLATTRALYSREGIAAIAQFRRGPNAAQVIEHLPQIQAPTLLTWGRDDRVSPLDISLLPMRLIPHCELHVFPNCGHWAMIECKAAFEAVTLAFLQTT